MQKWLAAGEACPRHCWGVQGLQMEEQQDQIRLQLIACTAGFWVQKQHLRLVPAGGFAGAKKLQPLTKLQKAVKIRFLQEAGLSGAAGDVVRLPSVEGRDLEEQRLHMVWAFLKWSLGMEETCSFVPPALATLYMQVADLEEMSAEDALEMAAAQQQRKTALEKLLEKPLVLVPVVSGVGAGAHWTLLVLETEQDGALQVRYRDSLTLESGACRAAASKFLQLLKGGLELPARINAAYQPLGGNQCGSYVAHWLEQECRVHLKESPCSAGWPTWRAWASRLHKLAGQLQSEQKQLQVEEKKEEEVAQKLEALQVAAAASAAAKKELDKLLQQLQALALKSGAKMPPAGKEPCLENLSPAAQEQVAWVKAHGLGLCSRCRWSTGCLSCSWQKTLKHLLKKEFGVALALAFQLPYIV